MKDLLQQLDAEEAELIKIREHLHKNPELSGLEEQTLAFIRDRLSQLDIPFTEVEKGGIFASIKNGESDKVILLRADIDALPVKEAPNNLVQPKKVVSQVDGVSHVCGHDAHTAMLLTAAKLIKQHISELDGTVLLCFERAEENGGPDHTYGVHQLLKYLDKNDIKPDNCLALHVRPNLDSGKISAEPGGVMAGIFGFEIRIKGAGGHGSRPDLANNPLDCFTAFYQTLAGLRMRHIDPYNLLTFSIPLVRMGSQGNVIDEELYFEGTVRSLDRKSLEQFRDAFLKQLEHFTAAFGCTYQIEFMYTAMPLHNNADMAKSVRETVEDLFGTEHYEPCEPSLGSESFAYFTQKYPGVMAFLGIRNPELGSGANLHADNFDLDESVLRYGAGTLAAYALKELKRKE